MIVTVTQKNYYALPKSNSTIYHVVELIERPLKKLVKSFWMVLSSPVERNS